MLAGSASAAGAAFIIACGGGDNGGSSTGSGTGGSTTGSATGATGATGSTGPTSSLVSPVVDETDSAKRGGVLRSVQAVPLSLDPHQINAGVLHVWHNYSPLFKVIEGRMAPAVGGMEGELVDSWEFSPDYLTLTAKITHDVAFAPLAPVNGRRVDAHDVAFSWERYNEISPRRGELAHEANPAAPILSVEAIDDDTVVFNLNAPDSTILSKLGGNFAGTYFIVPKEAADPNVLDLRQVGAGSGPFYVSEVVQSVSTTYKRNPGFKKDPRAVPYVDEAHYAELPEYATQLAQLKAGNIHDTYFNFRAEDILPTKQDVPALDVTPTPVTGLILRALFGSAPDSPFRDERVRQAYVRTWERDLFLNLAFNVDRYAQAGLPVQTVLESAVFAGAWQGWWLDPLSADFGPNTKYFESNLDEARKLMDAAGYPGTTDIDIYYVTPQPYQHLVDFLMAMVSESGLFNVTHEVMSAADFNATFRNNRGEFVGAGFITDNVEAHPVIDLQAHYHSNGGRYFGGDAHADELLDKATLEFDDEQQKSIIHEFQRYEGEKHFQPRLGGGNNYRITSPALRNKGVWRGSLLRWNATVWLDDTKAR
jgi:ABC-type transport system substrate-binding protein